MSPYPTRTIPVPWTSVPYSMSALAPEDAAEAAELLAALGIAGDAKGAEGEEEAGAGGEEAEGEAVGGAGGPSKSAKKRAKKKAKATGAAAAPAPAVDAVAAEAPPEEDALEAAVSVCEFLCAWVMRGVAVPQPLWLFCAPLPARLFCMFAPPMYEVFMRCMRSVHGRALP